MVESMENNKAWDVFEMCIDYGGEPTNALLAAEDECGHGDMDRAEWKAFYDAVVAAFPELSETVGEW